MNVLGLVPARGGSKGIPRKNELPLAGRTLVARAADAGRASGVLDRLVLSTDSERIAALGREAGLEVPFLRRPELARDEAPMLPVVEDAVARLAAAGWRADLIVLLQPTQPLRRPERIAEAVWMVMETGASSVVSVVEIPRHYAPEYAMRIEDGRLRTYLPEGEGLGRRQEAQPAYSRDGTVYVLRRTVVEAGDLYGDDCRPLLVGHDESVNLDTPEDWAAAERRLSA